MEQERHTQKISSPLWLPPLLFGCFALFQAGVMSAGSRTASLCVAAAAFLSAGILCGICIISWVRKEITAAARRLFLCAVLGMHGLWAWWGTMHDWTSFMLYLLSETPTCIAFLFLFRKAEPAKAVRTAYSFLAAKTILVDLLPFWYTGSRSLESIPPDSIVLFPPLSGLPAASALGIQFAALGIYVYKLTKDPVRWKKSIWV